MAGLTLAQAQAQLDVWLAASTAVASGQAYSVGGLSLSRVNAKEIRDSINFWEAKVKKLDRGGLRVRTVEVDE